MPKKEKKSIKKEREKQVRKRKQAWNSGDGQIPAKRSVIIMQE